MKRYGELGAARRHDSWLRWSMIAVLSISSVAWAGDKPADSTKLSLAERAQIASEVGATLKTFYVFPDKAAMLDLSLKQAVTNNELPAKASGPEFAEALTAFLQEKSGDMHLEVRYFPESLPPDSGGEEPSKEEQEAEWREHRRVNFGFDQVARFKGNIGYLALTEFGRPAQVKSRIAAAMDLLGDTEALIIDLRKTGGGDPDSVMLLASYLFDKPTHLNDIYWREGDRTESRWTTKSVAGKRYGEARKIYVLTSQRTFSAGEDFAYALKYAGRATLIGETTGGGAHPGNPRRVNEHFMMFVPNGRAINPVTKTDWEGVGVKPDVDVPADEALAKAEILALGDLIAAEKDPEWKHRLEKRRSELAGTDKAVGMAH